MKKKALGRGLGALIGEGGGVAATAASGYMLCPVGDITPNARQPRRNFEDKPLLELADSIKEKGIIEPLVVRRNQTGYELIAGERRWRAAKMAGLSEVPVVAMECTDEECLELAIIENVQREDLNPIEEAEAYNSLAGMGLSQEEVARKVGRDRATVANYLRLLKLPFEVKAELAKSSITMGHARALLSLAGPAAQRELCRRVISRGLSVRETERLASRSAAATGRAGAGRRTTVHLAPVEDELRRLFGTKVSVRESKGRGRIEIEYYSGEERERIIELLRSM